MPNLPSGLPEQIDDNEDLVRFLTSSGHYNSSIVKPSAFLPSPNGNETSVSRHSRKPAKRLWEIGLTAAGARTLHGAAFFKARDVRRYQLEVIADEPPDRHAAIRNWPLNTDPILQKAQHKELALLLSRTSSKPLLYEG
ncbi:MAG: hypothetical protein AB7V18_08270 [Pyrinomonadaceae bacterium]